jgi:hypothetical protein
MFNLKYWLNLTINPQTYIWIEALLIKETPKAILIEFDGKEIWLPRVWIKTIERRPTKRPKRVPSESEGQSPRERPSQPISLKISQYHWAKKM